MSDDRLHWYRRVRDMLGFIDTLERILEGKVSRDLENDEVLFFAVERLLQNIGEASIHLPEEIKAMQAQIPWRQIAGMRHVLVHGYDLVDETILWKAAKSDLQQLKNFLITLNSDELQ
ncbi:MAG: DUF86 domain-containing protein [Alphaproteobacteria bacterium]|nr:DUF86 domain-containing protein [Alphaproteobacteria bacterium]